MQNIDKNMDDLFRRAAAAYPLRETGNGWDKIAPRLMENEAATTAVQKVNAVKKCLAVLLYSLLFLFAAGIATRDVYNTYGHSIPGLVQVNEIVHPAAATLSGRRKARAFPMTAGTIQRVTNTIIDRTSNTDALDNNAGIYTRRNKLKNWPVSEVELPVRERVPDKEIDEPSIKERETAGGDFSTVIPVPVQLLPNVQIIEKSAAADTAANKTSIEKKRVKKIPAFYWGGIIGPSFNQVKSQGLKKPGFDIGILAGYQLTSKISLETGIVYEKKYYFSDGKYFDLSKASSGMPSGMQVLSLEGSCSILEIPFKVKYNLFRKDSRRIYTTAGLSGYIVTGEFNKYHAILNGTAQNIAGSYNKSSGYTAAVLVIGAGFENRLGVASFIRIEPYVQIPLRGIGVGALPVMTAGLHIGFTRFLK